MCHTHHELLLAVLTSGLDSSKKIMCHTHHELLLAVLTSGLDSSFQHCGRRCFGLPLQHLHSSFSLSNSVVAFRGTECGHGCYRCSRGRRRRSSMLGCNFQGRSTEAGRQASKCKTLVASALDQPRDRLI
jgi:hypothetical protein